MVKNSGERYKEIFLLFKKGIHGTNGIEMSINEY